MTSRLVSAIPQDCHYPLVQDLWEICFPDETADRSKGIEHEFQKRIATGDYVPIQSLAKALFKADYYLAGRLFPRGKIPDSAYSRFLDAFGASHYLTFNYDSLVEIGLMRKGLWTPVDGYGVEVHVDLDDTVNEEVAEESTSLVIHLHGTLCVFVSTVGPSTLRDGIAWINLLENSEFRFDPDSIAALYGPHERSIGEPGDDDRIETRIIAPVRNKYDDMKSEFVRASYEKAAAIVSSVDEVVAVGYGFSATDASSYSPILQILEAKRGRLVVVGPEANEIVSRLNAAHRKLESVPVVSRFADWVDDGFPGLRL